MKCSKQLMLESWIVFLGVFVLKHFKINLAGGMRICLTTSVNLYRKIESFSYLLVMNEREWEWERQRYLTWEWMSGHSCIQNWIKYKILFNITLPHMQKIIKIFLFTFFLHLPHPLKGFFNLFFNLKQRRKISSC